MTRSAVVTAVIAVAATGLIWMLTSPPPSSAAPAQPKIEARKSQVLGKDGLQFRDLNKNGTLDRYEDWRLPLDQRVAA